ncbi:uncharacterized protein LOC110812336 [Carica papaya]|uniref:uncharacterized protein LOC110812336 n=1 Tax=Carica papaya TaxID=3649 RepID=UPI000B8D0E2F|nr:uncharacterized protein LOC110812336 [Carica papaya]
MNQCGSVATMVTVFRPSLRPKCLASGINTEELRAQLDKLHAEADTARAKANSARLRLLRLSETAENLRRQAVTSIQTGKENDARALLFQKKKVMQALEKSKTRIELLDELSAKLNEAISLKETQLIGTIALDLEVNGEDDSVPVRIISPKHEFPEDNETKNVCKLNDNKKLYLTANSQADLYINEGLENVQRSLNMALSDEDNIHSSSGGVSSYKKFLEHLDQQLEKIETELDTILNVSTLVLNHDERPKNLKVQQTVELLESIRDVRQRIAVIIQEEVKIS